MEIMTGNELLSGATVYLDSDGNWQMDVNKARLFGAEDAQARDGLLKAAAATGRIVSLELEKVQQVNGKIIADRLRERIRAEGPTAPYGPERQNLEETVHVSL